MSGLSQNNRAQRGILSHSAWVAGYPLVPQCVFIYTDVAKLGGL